MRLPLPFSMLLVFRPVALGVLTLLTGCDLDGTLDTSSDSAGETAEPVDADGDGYPVGEDCDDGDPSAVPSTEVYGDALEPVGAELREPAAEARDDASGLSGEQELASVGRPGPVLVEVHERAEARQVGAHHREDTGAGVGQLRSASWSRRPSGSGWTPASRPPQP